MFFPGALFTWAFSLHFFFVIFLPFFFAFVRLYDYGVGQAEHFTHTQNIQHNTDGLADNGFPIYRQTKEEQIEEVLWYRQDQGSQEEQERNLNGELKSDAGAVVCRVGGVVVMMVSAVAVAEIKAVMMMCGLLLLLRRQEIQSF